MKDKDFIKKCIGIRDIVFYSEKFFENQPKNTCLAKLAQGDEYVSVESHKLHSTESFCGYLIDKKDVLKEKPDLSDLIVKVCIEVLKKRNKRRTKVNDVR